MKGGPLYDFWRNWIENQRTVNFEQTLDMINSHLPDITRAAIMAAKKDTPWGVRQRIDLMNRELGTPKIRAELDMRVVTFADWIKTQMAKENDDGTREGRTIPA